ncbi:hypothetical protein GY45DRAFT_457694 [Cubamyces sp. BRFM 1775]|nr:hypothetical protein GY45DRAFT_457694 [Cubamyces sp. BRFM 1775]
MSTSPPSLAPLDVSGRVPYNATTLSPAHQFGTQYGVQSSIPTHTSFAHRIRSLFGFGSSERARERRVLVKLLFSLAVLFIQIVLTVVLTWYGVTHQGFHGGAVEYSVCRNLAVMNLVWLGPTVVSCYLSLWAYYRSRGQSLSMDDLLCPLDIVSLHVVAKNILPVATLMCVVVMLIFLVQRGHTCISSAPHITGLSLTLLCGTVAFAVANYTILSAPIPFIGEREPMGSVRSGLTQAEIDRIPLVIYIPPPPDDGLASPTTPSDDSHLHSPAGPRTRRKKRIRFIFFLPGRRSANDDLEQGATSADANAAWEANWQRTPYRFVRLLDNQARCAICLTDFEAPRRVDAPAPQDPASGETHEMTPARAGLAAGSVEYSVPTESPHPTDAAVIQRVESGQDDGPQPLRLLSCGHAFHKGCIDQWLGRRARCPCCNLCVELPLPLPTKRPSIWGWGRA